MAPASAWKHSKHLSPRKRRRYVRFIVIALIIAAYASGVYYFSSHFTPGTTVDSVDASNMTVDELAAELQKRADSYTQHIVGGDGFDFTFTGKDVDLTFEGEAVATEALKRTVPYMWLPSLFTPQHMLIDKQLSFSEEKLTKILEEAVSAYNEHAEQPTNSKITYNEKDVVFETTQESVGTAIDASKVVEPSKRAVDGLGEEVQLSDDVLKQPSITSTNEDLQAAIGKANAILDASDIEVACDGSVIAYIDRATLASWIVFDDNNEFKIDGVSNWVESNQAIQDVGNAREDVYTYALDAQGTIDDIHRAIEQDLGSQAEVQRVVIETRPAATPGSNERGRHIDINLSTQYVRFYDSDGSVIWESYCVTGGYDPDKGDMHYTPTGTYAIQAKETGRTLIGADSDNDGEPDYESFVNYWMPFLNYDYGLHDATWRWDFGGDIRSWWGSHGCVNLPYEKAEQLYNLVNVGDTVYIHE